MEDFIRNVPTNGKFLYSAFYAFTNQDMMPCWKPQGVPVKTERGGRVFPVSDSAKDVAEALKRYALKKNVCLMHAQAQEVLIKNGAVSGVYTDKGFVDCDSVILAAGGRSYPRTGSTGDGYRMAEKAGHTIITPRPSLIPIVTKEKWVSELMGLSLKNVELTVYNEKGKKIYSDFGEMLFTHFGISGPIVLSASAHLREPEKKQYKITVDLKPALTSDQLDKRILRDFSGIFQKVFAKCIG